MMQVPKVKSDADSWSEFLKSPSWQHELNTAHTVAPDFQIKATDAVAAAIWSVLCHWDNPEDAIIAAVHYGGDTDTIAAMAGNLVGALYGDSWIPARWYDKLENGPDDGRDHVVQLAQQLAQLDVRS